MRQRARHDRAMKLRTFALPWLLLLTAVSVHAQESQDKAQQLARDVWKASGGENWGKVKEMHFTFIVEGDGKQLASVQHEWNVPAQTDHVKWKDKDLTVNVAKPAEDEASKAAYGRWVNDGYWLIAPLKLLDPGVKLAYEGSKDMDGVQCETLHVSFEQVGLTPGDQYLLYIDPKTKLIRSWDYMPKADTMMHGSWDKYETFGGLTLATEHNFGGKMIRFADVKVTTQE
jgi:hypothetical protein